VVVPKHDVLGDAVVPYGEQPHENDHGKEDECQAGTARAKHVAQLRIGVREKTHA
jgi:hypothetical protein